MQKKMIASLLLTIAISSVLSSCQEGCLRCDTEKDLCLFCDTKAGFQTVRGKCIFSKQQNCAIQNHKGNCLFCNKGYYVDSFTYTCVISSKAGNVENCQEYVVDNQCYMCKEGFHLTTRNTCIAISSPIANCYKYSSPDLCSICESDYLMSIDQKLCTAAPSFENCTSYTPLKCVDCQSGHQHNRNNYLYELLSFSSKRNLRKIEDRLLLDYDLNYRQDFSVCQPNMIPHCNVHDEFNYCAICDAGYYWKLGRCYAYPSPKIYNCVTYTAVDECVECRQGYYLSSPQFCVKVDDISDCVTYDPKETQTLCTECQMDFYLSEENVCSTRTNQSQISQCQEFSLIAEECVKCEQNFTLTTDKKKCLQSIPKCKLYVKSDSSNTQHECDTCVDGFFYDMDIAECLEGSVEKCKTYYKNSNTCKICQNKFYLTGGVCKNHEDLIYCLDYKNSLKNSCDLCNDRTVLFKRSNTCLPVEPIRYCQQYRTQTECEICEDGYEVTFDIQCELIPKDQFCRQKRNGGCIQCLENYVLEQGQCNLPLHHLIRNCDSHTVNGLNNYSKIKCDYCREFHIPINYKDSFVCYEDKYLEDQMDIDLQEGCAQYKWVDGEYICVTCKREFILNDGECQQLNICPNNSTLRLQVIQQVDSNGDGSFDSFYVDKINECGEPLKNCEIAAPDLNQNLTTIRYSCTKCLENSLSIVAFDDDSILSKPPREMGESPVLSPLSITSSRECEVKSTSKILGEVKNDEVPQCDLYYNLTNFGYGCLRCNRGQTGIVVDLVDKCEVYGSLTTCVKCLDFFYPKTPFRCERVQPIQYCQKYENNTTQGLCIECKEGFYFDNGKCESRTNFVENCTGYEPNSQHCVQCLTDYELLQNGNLEKCVKKVQSCSNYDYNSEDCIVCNKDHYIVNNLCYEGQVTNCSEYEYNPNMDVINKCVKCENQYYLTNNNTCLQQPTIDDCDTYFQEQGYCKTCAENHFLFETPNKCISTIVIDNCSVYKSKESCEKCDDGFYPVNYGQRCLSIPTDKHCLIWGELTNGLGKDQDNCQKCQAGYLLINRKCKLWFQSITENCIQDNTNIDGQRKYSQCKYCDISNGNVLSKDISTDNGVCTEDEFLSTYFSDEVIANCQSYSYDDTTSKLICQNCKDDYYLLYVDNNTDKQYTKCLTVDECVEENVIEQQNIYILNNNYADLAANSNTLTLNTNSNMKECRLHTLNNWTDKVIPGKNCVQQPYTNSSLSSTASNNYGWQCSSCPSDYPIKIIALSASQKISPVYNPQFVTQTSDVIDSCESVSTVVSAGILGKINGKGLISNCNYYAALVSGYGCVQCIHGYRGKYILDTGAGGVSGFIAECEEFTDCSDPMNYNQIHTDPHPLNYPLATTYNVSLFDLNAYFVQCQSCANTVVSFLDNDGIQKSYKSTDLSLNPADTFGYNTECLDNGDTYGGVVLTIISDCAKALFFLTDNVLICVSCKKGFYPTRDTANDGAKITACTAFTGGKCTTSNNDNICNVCPTDYYHPYDSTTKKINYEADCINPVVVNNCYAMTSVGACAQCKMGYSLKTISGVQKCVLINPAKCESGIHELTTIPAAQIFALNFEYKYRNNFCRKCNSGFSNVVNFNEMVAKLINNNKAPDFVQAPSICYETTTDYYDDQAPVPTTAYDKCDSKYSYYLMSSDTNNMDIHCRECDNTGVITLNGKCVNKPDNLNCQIAIDENSNFCHECDATYISVAGVCTLETDIDSNCDQFADSSFVTGATCSMCKDFYYLEAKIQDGQYVTNCIEYYDTNIGETPSNNNKDIKNCAQFNSDDLDRLYCTKCETTYSLLVLQGDEVNGQEGYNRKCVDVSSQMTDMNCSKLKVEPQINGKMICDECLANTGVAGYFMKNKSQQDVTEKLNTCVAWEIDPNCKTYHIDKQLERIYQSVTYKYNYLPRYSQLKCQECEATFYMKQDVGLCTARTNTYNAKCHVYEIHQDFCSQCIENYFLSSDKLSCNPAPNQTESKGHIFSCKEMEECHNEVQYTGLNSKLEILLSCHKCKQTSQIPFVAISGQATYSSITSLKEYNVEGDFTVNTYKDFKGGKSVFCTEATKESFNITNVNKWAFPTNCAVGVLNVDSLADASNSATLTNVDRTKVGVFCGACKTGYYPTYGKDAANVELSNMIASCTLIPNCKYSEAFNNCTQCEKGYSFDYQDGKVNYQTCVQLSNTSPINYDCFSYDSTNGKCVFCAEGTYLNADDFCERIQPPKCRYQHFAFKNIYNKLNLSTGLYLNSRGTGCTECEKGYSSLFQSNNKWVCTESMSHKKDILPTGSLYLKECKNYYIDQNLLKCKKCYTNYVPIQSTGVCTSQITTLKYCVEAIDENYCRLCEDDYVLVNRICQAKNIDQCEIYYYNENSQDQICKECEEGYYLEANQCLPGKVENCLRFETKIVCNECHHGFHLVKRNDGVSYCYPIDETLNCKAFDSQDFQQAQLTCKSCINNQFVISTDYHQFYDTHCLRFFEINNCVAYDIRPAVGDSSFACIQCTEQFYLKDNKCVIRSNKSEKCVKYQTNDDKCLECDDGFFASVDGLKCLEYPTGVNGCIIYSSKYVCQRCEQNKYQSGDYCLVVPELNLIENCLYYVDKYNCDECDTGYLLKDGACVQIQAQNCATIESVNACATCTDLYGFVESNGIKDCVVQNVPNCLNINPVPVLDFAQGYKCIQCAQNFYLGDDGVCVAVTDLIYNCIAYESATTCERCVTRSALSVDKTKCISNRVVLEHLDMNCSETQILEQAACNSCTPGYIFEEGECVMCLTNNNRCYNCDPQDKTKCMMCKSGFVMMANGQCESLVILQKEKEQKEKEEQEKIFNEKEENKKTDVPLVEAKNNLASSGIELKSLLSAFFVVMTFF